MSAEARIELDRKVDLLEEQLRRKMETETGFADDATKVAKLNRIFRHFNADNDGFLSFEEFNAALVRLNFVGVQKEIRAMFDRYDEDASDYLSYEEFGACVFGFAPNAAGSAESRSVVERARAAIMSRYGVNGFRGVRTTLRSLDVSGDNKLDRDELKVGLAGLGLELSASDLDKLMNVFDVNGDGLITVEEFFRGLRGGLNKRRRQMIDMAFDVFDRDGSGEVTLADVSAAYNVSEHPDVKEGRMSPEEALKDFLDAFDSTNKDGIVTRAEFRDYYKDISAGIDHDDYFELMIRNAWHISGGEGWAENTSNLRVLVTHSDGSQEVVGLVHDLGIARDDMEAIRKQLEAQGVEDVVEVSTAH
jgi:Ca2+-binding EF-hand superfamily protein